MYGEAFKCDRCGRVVFTQRGPAHDHSGQPPLGWFGLSQVGEPETTWPLYHFDTLECLYDFLGRQVMEQESSPQGDGGDEPTPSPEPAEVVISAWEQDADAIDTGRVEVPRG